MPFSLHIENLAPFLNSQPARKYYNSEVGEVLPTEIDIFVFDMNDAFAFDLKCEIEILHKLLKRYHNQLKKSNFYQRLKEVYRNYVRLDTLKLESFLQRPSRYRRIVNDYLLTM